jgi:hypothetical protein
MRSFFFVRRTAADKCVADDVENLSMQFTRIDVVTRAHPGVIAIARAHKNGKKKKKKTMLFQHAGASPE